MNNIAKVRLLTTFRTGKTSDTQLFEEGAEYEAPFPRIIQKEFNLRPHLFEVIAYKSEEPAKTKVSEKPKEVEKPEVSEKPKLKLRG